MLSKPLPILSHMPWHIKQQITDSADTVTKSSLRFCSKDFNKFVRNSSISYKQLTLTIGGEFEKASLFYSIDRNHSIKFEFENYLSGYRFWNSKKRRKQRVKDGKFVEALIEKTAKVIGNPKVSFGKFKVKFEETSLSVFYESDRKQFVEQLGACLGSLNFQLAATAIDIQLKTGEEYLQFLRFFKPGTLQSVRFERREGWPRESIDLDEIAATEQWKRACWMDLSNFNSVLPFENWKHFTWSHLSLLEVPVSTVEMACQSFSNNRQFQNCYIYSRNISHQSILEYLFQLNAEVTEQSLGIRCDVKVPNRRDVWLWILVQKMAVSFEMVCESDELRRRIRKVVDHQSVDAEEIPEVVRRYFR